GNNGRTRTEHVVTIIPETPDVEVAEVVVGEALAGVSNLVVRVGQVVDQVASEPADLAAQRWEPLGPRTQVVEVEVPDVDVVGPLHTDHLEAVPVREQLLPKVRDAAKGNHAERGLEVVGFARQPRPVE